MEHFGPLTPNDHCLFSRGSLSVSPDLLTGLFNPTDVFRDNPTSGTQKSRNHLKVSITALILDRNQIESSFLMGLIFSDSRAYHSQQATLRVRCPRVLERNIRNDPLAKRSNTTKMQCNAPFKKEQ